MAKIVVTSGPTRQYLDPVRYLTNASSGQMGRELAIQGIKLGHDVTIVSGPVSIDYPREARVVNVVTTEEMLVATREHFRDATGLIGVAAPCDYMPHFIQSQKIPKTGNNLVLELVETPDIVATLAAEKHENQWVVGFALETEDRRHRAIAKMQRKRCNLMVSNSAAAINATETDIEILNADGMLIEHVVGSKKKAAQQIWQAITSYCAVDCARR